MSTLIDALKNLSPRARAGLRQVEEWNARYPAGTPVTVTLDDRSQAVTKTRSAAWMLGADGGNPGHTAVVLLEGRSGAFLLSRCRPRKENKR